MVFTISDVRNPDQALCVRIELVCPCTTICSFSMFVCGSRSKPSLKLLAIDDFETSRGKCRNFGLFDYVETKQLLLRQF